MSELPQENERRAVPPAFVLGLLVVALLLGGIWFASTLQKAPEAVKPLAFGEAEQAYAKRVRFTDIEMGRAKNFLGHEVTIISGFVENMGNQTIREMSFRIEFLGFSQEVVMQEEIRFLGGQAPPLEGGRRRDFQFNFEKVPDAWSQSHPRFHITGLSLEQ